MAQRIRVGFIGTGGIAGHHLTNLHRAEDVELVAMCDVVKDRAEARAKEFGGRPYTRFEEMYEQEALDAVYVCVPPFSHGDAELMAVERGIPLFVEKPIDVGIDVAVGIRDAIARAGLITSVGYNWRYSDAVERSRERLNEHQVLGAIGAWMGGMPGVAWWRVKSQSGGQHVEQTTHVFDMCRYLLGADAVSVHAVSATGGMADVPNYDIQDISMVNITFSNGTVANVQSACCLSGWGRVKIEIFGKDLAADITQGRAVFTTGRDEKDEIETTVNPYVEEDRTFIDAVKEGDGSAIRAPYADAVQTQKITTAATKSMEAGKVVFIQNDQFVVA